MFSQLLSRVFKIKENSSPEEMDPLNGSKLRDVYFPDEVLELILCHVEIKTLLKCRRVCKKWNSLISDQVMKTKASWSGFTEGMSPEMKQNIPWSTWYTFLSPDSLFGCNLIRNPCGEEDLKHWNIIRQAGDGWKTEKTPEGLAADVTASPSDILLRNYHEKKTKKSASRSVTACFVSSYGTCEKEQMVNLAPATIMESILDTLKPTIVYREWFCRRFDCGGTYSLHVGLYDKDMNLMEEKNHHTSIDGDFNWLRVENKFENYPEGVRFVKFRHRAVDNQFWKGHYGPKLTRATLILLPPGLPHTTPVDNNLSIVDPESVSDNNVGWDGIAVELIPPGHLRAQLADDDEEEEDREFEE